MLQSKFEELEHMLARRLLTPRLPELLSMRRKTRLPGLGLVRDEILGEYLGTIQETRANLGKCQLGITHCGDAIVFTLPRWERRREHYAVHAVNSGWRICSALLWHDRARLARRGWAASQLRGKSHWQLGRILIEMNMKQS